MKALIVCATGLLILSSVDLSRNIHDFRRESRSYAGGTYRTKGISGAEGEGAGLGGLAGVLLVLAVVVAHDAVRVLRRGRS